MRKLTIIRTISQIIFFSLFVYLVFATEYHFSPDKETVPSWLKIFYDINPLNLLGTSLAAGILYSSLVLGFILLVATIFFGRFFCGWICPLGSLNHFFSAFKSERKSHRGQALMRSNVYKPYQSIKYYLLIIILGMALFGSLQSGLFDPISILGRSLGLVVFPAITFGLKMIFGWLWSVDFRPVALLGEGLSRLSSALFMPIKQPHFHGVFWLGAIFLSIIIANRLYTRFWCRALCPLGALLGFCASLSIFGLKKSEIACDGCGKCLLHCQGGDNPHKELPHRRNECHMCLNCLEDCNRNAITFGFYPDKKYVKRSPELSRRKVMFAGLAGILAVPTLGSGIDTLFQTKSKLIRPPGAVAEADFLARCIRCGQCMKICPTNAIHPTTLEAGWEGIFSPMLIPAIGYCEYNCVLCGQSCPTSAIQPLTPAIKTGGGGKEPVRIGTAFIDKGRCLPWGFGKDCIVCEEWCPTSPKAIIFETVNQIWADGRQIKIRRPVIVAEYCIGCGACEYACPVQGQKAIYVNSVGETRQPQNEMLLHRPKRV
jgi:polyferredoxin